MAVVKSWKRQTIVKENNGLSMQNVHNVRREAGMWVGETCTSQSPYALFARSGSVWVPIAKEYLK